MQKQQPSKSVEAALLEGLDSGTATPMTSQDWEAIRQSVRERKAQQNHDG
ncbi:hypothetical protein [Phormidesmis priestleyi]